MSERILAIRFGALGDVLLTFPALCLIRRRYPAARLEVLTRPAYAELVRAHPGVDAVQLPAAGGGPLADLRLAARLRGRRYARLFDLHGTPRSRLVAALSGAAVRRRAGGARLARRRLVAAAGWRRLGGRPRGGPLPAVPPAAWRAARLVDPAITPAALAGLLPELRFEAPAAEAARLAPVLERLPARRVALCPGARHATKRWPEAAYAALAGSLAERGLGVLAVLGAGDAAPALAALAARRPEQVALVRGSLMLLGAALAACGACVGNDSGLSHLAAAAGVPVVVLFGATVPELGFAPLGPHRVVEQPQLGCRPCAVHGGARCRRGDLACLAELGAQRVLREVEALLAAASSGGAASRVS